MGPVEGNYTIHSPESDVNLGNVTATGDIDVTAKGGAVGNLTSTEGSVRVSMRDNVTASNISAKGDVSVVAIDQSVSPSLLALIEQMKNQTSRNFQFTPVTTTVILPASSLPASSLPASSLPASSSTEPAEQISKQIALGTVVGKIMRCACCGCNSSRFTGPMGPSQMSTTTKEISFSDPAKKRHVITENGIYEVKYAGDGQFVLHKVKDSIHC